MKKLLFIAVCFFHSIHPYSLALVHIGDELPPFLADSIKQARLFNPACPFYLIANKKALSPSLAMLKTYHVTPLEIELLPKTERHVSFLQKTNLQPGFWRYACERFLYLDDFMHHHKITDLFHIENDVMIYADLSELLPLLKQNYRGIAAVFDNDDRCIPSFMFIPDLKRSQQLANGFVEHASKGKFDMQLIALFRNQVGPEIIDRLPIIMDAYIKTYKLKNKLGKIPTHPQAYANNVAHFKSIFDAAALGQYLGGTFFADHGAGFINETCVFDPSKLSYEWINDSQGRKIPYAIFSGEKYRINNLHIHSKQLGKFASL